MPIAGHSSVRWHGTDWFHAILRFHYPEDETARPLLLEYKGRLTQGTQRYTFVLQHSQLGRVEGEGWIAPATLLHRYWVLGGAQKRFGIESFFRANESHYCYSSSVTEGLKLLGGIEAAIERR